MIYIGIDPAFRKNGFGMCILDFSDKTANFYIFKSFFEFLSWLTNERPKTAFYCIENSNLQKKCWQKNAMSVGKNQAASQYTVDACKYFCGDKFIREISPLEKGGKEKVNMIFKIESKKWRLHNYKGLVSEQDKRDSFLLALLSIRNV